MKRENIKKIIKELATQNFNLYPESYPIVLGLVTNEAAEAAQNLGIAYYQSRTEDEIERDEMNGITEIDYVEWVMEAFGEWVQEAIER